MTSDTVGLTSADLDLLLESLRYTREAFATYNGYPSEDFRRERLQLVDDVATKLRSMRSG